MIRAVVPSLALACLLAGCSAPAAKAPSAPAPQAPQAPTAGLGQFAGTGKAGKGSVEIRSDFQGGSKVVWSEKRDGAEKEFSGKWRLEGADLLLLLQSKDGENLSLVLEKKGDVIELLRYQDEEVKPPVKLAAKQR